MGEAFRIAKEEMATENERIRMLRDRLLQRPARTSRRCYVNGDLEQRVPHNLNVSFNFVEGESLIMAIKDLAVSSRLGLHLGQPGAVLRAARTGPQRRTGAQLDPLHHRPLHAPRKKSITPSTCCNDKVGKLRELSPLWEMYQGRHRSEYRAVGCTLNLS